MSAVCNERKKNTSLETYRLPKDEGVVKQSAETC